MSGSKKEGQKRAARAIEDPVLADFDVPWPDLVGGEKVDVGRGFERIGERLSKSKRSALVRVTLGEGEGARAWSLALQGGKCDVSKGAEGRPDLEILTSEEVWSEIASGAVTPLEAFGSGRVRVRGDIELARVLARRVRDV